MKMGCYDATQLFLENALIFVYMDVTHGQH